MTARAYTPRLGPDSSRSSPEFPNPYEAPENADLDIDTTDITPEEAANMVILNLEKVGFISLKS